MVGHSMEELHLPLDKLKRWIHSLYLFLHSHREITSAHSVDFFTCNYWDSHIQPGWREELLSASEEQLVEPNAGGSPDSLGEFLQKASNLRLPLLVSKLVHTTQQADSHSLLKFGMNTKKSYEVESFSQHVHHLTALDNIRQVMDIGSGKGYLSQHLALHYGLTVIGVDAQEINTLGAQTRNRKVHKAWENLKRKQHLIQVDEDGEVVDEEDLHESYCPLTLELKINTVDELLKQVQALSGGKFDPLKPFCITGLHTCGDLAANILRLFLQSPAARAMCVVGCCYHHISECGAVDTQVPGFPLSAYLKSLGPELGRTTLMLACQTISKISTTVSGSSLQLVFWRALLQVILKRKFPQLYTTRSRDITVGRLRHKPDDFLAYVKTAVARLKLDISNVTDVEILDVLAEYQHKEVLLKAFLQVKTVLAPCIESLLILDRLLYLQEQDDTLNVYLVSMFQPEISPRCVAITARRY